MSTIISAQPYLASKDKLHFNRWQTRQQQHEALCRLSYRQLTQLRHAIRFNGERIPGRSATDSLAMVEHIIEALEDFARDNPIPRSGTSPLVPLMLIFLVVGILLTMPIFVPQVAEDFLRLTGL